MSAIWAAGITAAGSLLSNAAGSTTTNSGSVTSGTTKTTGSGSSNTTGTSDTTSGSITLSSMQQLVDSITRGGSTSNSLTTNDTTTGGTTANTADPQAIAQLRQLAATATANSTDGSKTADLVNGILLNAKQSLTSVFGTQNQAGLYDSSAAGTQVNDTAAKATALAAQAVLGYQTTEQSQAASALNSIIAATGQTTTSGFSNNTTANQTNTANDSETTTSTQQDVGQATNATSDTTVNQDTTTTNKSNQNVNQTVAPTSSTKSISVVCTYMFFNRLLSKERYRVVSMDYALYPDYLQKAYLRFAAHCLAELARDPRSYLSRYILSMFDARTEYICAGYNLDGCSKTTWGFLCVVQVWLAIAICNPGALKRYLTELVTRKTVHA